MVGAGDRGRIPREPVGVSWGSQETSVAEVFDSSTGLWARSSSKCGLAARAPGSFDVAVGVGEARSPPRRGTARRRMG